jgi:hypothetical protein
MRGGGIILGVRIVDALGPLFQFFQSTCQLQWVPTDLCALAVGGVFAGPRYRRLHQHGR